MSNIRTMAPEEVLAPGKRFLAIAIAQTGPAQRLLDGIRELASVRSTDGPDVVPHRTGLPAMAEMFQVILPIRGSEIAAAAFATATRSGVIAGLELAVVDAFDQAVDNVENWIDDHKQDIKDAGEPFRNVGDFFKNLAAILPYLPAIGLALVGVLAYSVATGKLKVGR